MAQVSYGTITITDTNDINRIYVEYCRSTSNQLSGSTVPGITVNWSESTPAWVDGQYLWQRAVIEKSGTLEKTYGTPVCITGAQGETGSQGSTGAAGRSLTSTTTQYTTAATNATITQSNMGNYTWSSNVPTYNSSTPAYWVRITNVYSNPSSTEYIIYKDNGITDAVKTSHDANTTASAANTTANSANTTANNANTKADNAVTSVNNLQNKLKYYWVNEVAHTNGVSGWTKPNYPVGTYAASGISGTTFDAENSSTYGYNTWYANGINLRYNAIKLGELTGSALTFYQPSTTNQGAKAMELSGSALKFYASNGTTVQAEFGGSKARVSGTINAYDGQIGNSEDNYWYIGNYLDYFENQSAIIKSHGTASIQLGDSNTWRIATNRIHTAWNNDSSSGDAFKLHFPVYDNKYWDSGLHLPTSANDKLLYIRNSSSSNTLTYLNEALEDQYTNRWNYLFYITNSGSIYAKNIYVLDDNGQATQIGGTDGVYLLKSGGTITGNLEVNGTLTKSSKNVAYLTATPTSGQILIADGTSGGIKTSGYTIAKSVPSNALFTDENVKSTEANTTKLWLVGSDTSGTRTGTLKYDSGVYITTTAGTLHATTFEGALSGTASRATADADGNTIKTTYLKLTGGNVTGAVTFGSSISATSASIVDLTVTGNASFTNNISANTINGVTVGSTPKFTDANVTQTATTTSAAYEVLFSYTADNTTRTEGARKTSTLTYNPSTKELTVGTVKIKEASTGFTISGGTTSKTLTVGGDYTLAAAAAKGVVTSIDTSANLPTSNAVKTFVEGKGYITASHTSTYSLPLAANGTRGGVQIGYTTSGKNYAVQLSGEKMYVNVPWTDNNTTYTIATGTSNGKIKITPSSGNAYEISVYGWTDWLPLTGGQVTGPVSFGDSVSIDDLTVGQLIVNGNASFVNGLTTTTVNGYAPAAAMAKGVVTSVDTSANLPTSNAVKTFVENKGYVTSSGVTSVTVAATSPVQSSTGTAQTSSSVSTTISLKDGYGDTKNPYASKTANYVLAAPNGSNGVPTFRALVAADIPNLNWSKITAGKPTTLSGYGITDAAGTNALVGLEASSNAQGVTTFTATRASGTDPLSFEVSITASSATGATKLKDSSGDISLGAADHPVYFSGGVPAQSYYIPKLNGSNQTSAASFYAPTSGGTADQVLVSNGNAAPKWVNQSSIISGNKDEKIKLTNTTGNADYRILLSYNANDTNNTEEGRKSTSLRFNPSTGLLKTYGISSVNGLIPVIYSEVSATEIKAVDNTLTTSSSDSDWLKALLVALCTKYPNKNAHIFKGTMAPNSTGWYEVLIYNTSTKDGTTGLPQYSFGRFLKYINNYELFGTAEYSYSYRTVDTNTTYSAGTGISLSGTTFSNSGVRSISTGGTNGTISVNTGGTSAEVAIKGLGSNAYTSTAYLPLTGGTMTGGITFGNTSNAWNTKGIIFASGSRIGEDTSAVLGLYGAKIVIRPNSTSSNSGDGVEITGDGLYPSSNNTESLGTSSNKWANVYATTFNGNATSATKATQDGDGNVIKTTYLKLTGGNVTGATTFGSSVSINSLSVVDMVCTGSASFTNGLSGSLNGNATSATKANLTSTTNAVAYYTDATGTFGSKASANGALYATSANGALNWGTLPIAQGGTGKTTAIAAITNLGGPYLLAAGTEITASANLDSGYKAMGTYYSPNNERTTTLTGTVPISGSGFKLITAIGYRTATLRQFVAGASNDLHYRSSQDTGSTWTKWHKFVFLPAGNDNKTFAAIGGTNAPVYINSSGIVTACTSYANAKVKGANLTTTANAVAYYTDATGTFGSKASANGALYATSANGALNWGTLPIAQGGTGATTAANARTNLGLGSAATYTAATSVGNNSNLPTGAAIQTYVSGVVGSYVTLGTDQTITANQKTFNGAIRWGTSSKYGAAHYDSTLEAIVFSFT